MPVPTSNISLSSIQSEFGGSSPISLSEYYRGGVNVPSGNSTVPTSGVLKFSNFSGLTKAVTAPSTFTIAFGPTSATFRGDTTITWSFSTATTSAITMPLPYSGNITGFIDGSGTINVSIPSGVSAYTHTFTTEQSATSGGSASSTYSTGQSYGGYNFSGSNTTFTMGNPLSLSTSISGSTSGTSGSTYMSITASSSNNYGSATYNWYGYPNGMYPSGSSLSGTPSQSGSFSVYCTVTDALGRTATSNTMSLSIAAPAPVYSNPTVTLSALTGINSAILYDAHSPILVGSISSGGGSNSYSIVSSTLPAGLSFSISGSNIYLSGTPTSSGASSYSIVVKEGTSNLNGSASNSINVATSGTYSVASTSKISVTYAGTSYFATKLTVNVGNHVSGQSIQLRLVSKSGGSNVFNSTGTSIILNSSFVTSTGSNQITTLDNAGSYPSSPQPIIRTVTDNTTTVDIQVYNATTGYVITTITGIPIQN